MGYIKKLALGILFFSLSVQTAFCENFNIVIIEQDFDFEDRGHAEATLSIDGLPSGVIPEWKITSVQNNSRAMMEGWSNKLTGLSWERPSAGNYRSSLFFRGITPVLTDIIGERLVCVTAKFEINGKITSLKKTVTFGKGPLSFFEQPNINKVSWLEAYKICNGLEYSGDPALWVIGIGFVGSTKMPTIEMLQAVSMPGNKNPVPYAMGAALAAGWEAGKYWNGRAVMKGRASYVDISNGNIHGSGGWDATQPQHMTCIKHED